MYSNRRRYISIDIETTGLDSEYCQILEIGAVIDDWVRPVEQLPTFHAYVYHNRIVGQPFALQMNASTLKQIASVEKEMRNSDYYSDMIGGQSRLFCRPKSVINLFSIFLDEHNMQLPLLAAGKNFAGFDRPFLECLPGWNITFHRRVIDPAMRYWDPDTDDVPPSMQRCMELAGITGEVAHTAVQDARMVIKLIRH